MYSYVYMYKLYRYHFEVEYGLIVCSKAIGIQHMTYPRTWILVPHVSCASTWLWTAWRTRHLDMARKLKIPGQLQENPMQVFFVFCIFLFFVLFVRHSVAVLEKKAAWGYQLVKVIHFIRWLLGLFVPSKTARFFLLISISQRVCP